MADGRQRVEEGLERLRAAVEAFYAAAAEVARVMEEFCDRMDQPEGASAVERAVHHKAQAISNYRVILESCSEGLRDQGVPSGQKSPP